MPETEVISVSLELGVAVTYPLWPGPFDERDLEPNGMSTTPPGMSADATHKLLVGTPTELGTTEIRFLYGTYSNPMGPTFEVTVVAELPEDPDPDPEDPGEPGDPLDPFDLYGTLARDLAPRVASFVGKHGDEDTIATAEAQVPVVTEYVRGFTRGRGFEDEAPAGPLRAVIVSGVARLATNPEQVSHFQTGDYSEKPAQLAGWTLTELGVLRRYRRVTA